MQTTYMYHLQQMSSYSSVNQVLDTFNMFPSQPDIFSGPSNMFATSTPTHSSSYHPISLMQYYRPMMSSQEHGNVEQNDDQ